jgi:broad specificity phosphatase PhoE
MRLIVVRHAQPAVDPDTPQASWALTDGGRAAARRLARNLEEAPDAVVSSPERKAVETAEPITARFGLVLTVDERLREANRPWIDGDYPTLARQWLSGEPLDGWEPWKAVAERWETAILQTTSPGHGTVVIVGHGLAMTAWAVHRFGIEPVAFWTALDFPCVREFAV